MPSLHRHALMRLAAPALLAAILLPSAPARAQNVQDMLGTILEGVMQGQSGDVAEQAARACIRAAEDERLEVRRVIDAERSGNDDIRVSMRVDDRRDGYTMDCTYDSTDRQVRRLERASRDDDERHGRVDERLEERAREACKDVAQDRDYRDVDVVDVRERGRDRIEVALEGERDRDRRDLTCLYDDERREADLDE